MAIEDIGNIVNLFVKELTDTSSAYVTAVSTAIMGYLAGYMITFFKISLIMLGIAWIFKREPFDLSAIMDAYIKFILITAIALNFEYFHLIIDVFIEFPNGIAAAAISSFGGIGDIDNVNTLLGEFIKAGLKAAELSYAKPAIIMPAIIGTVILISTVVSAAGLLVIIVLSEILLHIILAIGPVFIVAKMFNTWNKLFDMWIQQCVNFALVPVFGYMIAMFTLTFSKKAVDAALDKQTLAQAVMILFIAFINWIALKKAYELAASVSSGFATTDEYRARRAAYDGGKKAANKVGSGVSSVNDAFKNLSPPSGTASKG